MQPSPKGFTRKSLEVEKPWGGFRRYAFNEVCTVKILVVNPGQMLSKQSHSDRDELWVFLDDGLTAEVGGEQMQAKTGDEIVIPRGTQHRLRSADVSGRVLEVSFGRFDEGDVLRTEDIYGRA
jgi:mannose-1-phosphate guanylyltransferase/mannose-6-phosphate isomerase